jgi:CRISPR-associated endonuclease/helicase Cas3
MRAIAHTKNVLGERQDLEDHLRKVAEAAGQFCAPFGGEDFARYAGLLHDIGKYDPAFQKYLLLAEQKLAKQRGPDHKGAGTVLAYLSEKAGNLAFLVNGHHGGLIARSELGSKIRERQMNQTVQDAIKTAKGTLPDLRSLPGSVLPSYISNELEQEFFVRMAFSALVDADFLDTEQHFNAGKRPERENDWSIAELWKRFETAYQGKFASAEHTGLNAIRSEVYQHCLTAASLPHGFFRLTVPTGGGKTLSSLAFALQHALKHDLQRIIYAIPYTSIIDQTASVFRDIFGDTDSSLAFIEHHSDIVLPDPQNPTLAEIRRRLMAENWDTSLIVTTTVQLFESLFNNGTSKCRKLHNIARSVLILDEVQMLPIQLLTPILDALRQLVAHYGVSVVFCTATQPDFEARQGFEGVEDIQEIIPEQVQARHFATLQRVTYEFPAAGETWTWEQVAARIQIERQALVILNTRRDATDLLDILTPDDSLDEPDATLFHLSTRLCGMHRKAVLEEIRRRLKQGEPCRLIATQVIEAGVDVDFPLVLRALGPLDRIVQAAGRANREGKMPQPASVIVFQPSGGHLPKGSYRVGADITQKLLKDTALDLHDPGLYQTYFRNYYGYPYLDQHGIQELRKLMNYPEVASKFRMIEDDSKPVVVKYSSSSSSDQIKSLLEKVKNSPGRKHLRALQPYTVNLLGYEFEKAKARGLICEIIPDAGIWEWLGAYDSGYDGKHGRGIVLDSAMSAESAMW